MQQLPVSRNEKGRITALRSYDVLDTPNEQEFDNIAQLAADICNTPIALINLIDENRQWFKSTVGIALRELPREFSFCHFTVLDDELFEVGNPLGDSRFTQNPLVTGEHGIRYYAGVPLVTPDGYRIGTLCVMSPRQHQLNSYQRISMGILAGAVMAVLEVRKQQKESELYRNTLAETLALAIVNEEDEVLFANSLFMDMSGLGNADVVGKKYNDIKLADLDPNQAKEIAQAIENGRLWKGVIKNQNIKGAITWSEYLVKPFAYNGGHVGKVLYIRKDITAEVLASQRLEDTEALTTSGSWELNVFNRQTQWTKGMYSLFGFDEVEDRPTEQSVMNFVSPADFELVNEVNKKLLEKKSNAEQLQFRILTRKGEEKNISAIVKKRYNNKGGLTSIFGSVTDITAQNQVHHLLGETERKLTERYNNAPVGYVSLTITGSVLTANATFLNWLGYVKEDIGGGLPFTTFLSTEAIPVFEYSLKRSIDTASPFEASVNLVAKNGTVVIATIQGQPVNDNHGNLKQVDLTIINNTAIVQATQTAEAYRAGLRKTLQADDFLLFDTDTDGNCTYVSPKLQAFSGMPTNPDKLSFFYDETWERKAIDTFEKQLLELLQEHTVQLPLKSSDGEKRWMEVRSLLLTEDMEVTGLRHILTDVTALQTTTDQLSEFALMAMEAKERQLEMISKISDGVRQPLQGIIGMVKLLTGTQLAMEQKVLLDAIQEASRKILNGLEDIADPTVLKPTAFAPLEAEMELKPLLKATIAARKAQADSKNIKFVLQVDNKVPATLLADADRLGKILLHLIDLALSQTDSGTISLSVLQKDSDGHRLNLDFAIKDTGTAIPQHLLDSLLTEQNEALRIAKGNVTEQLHGLAVARQLVLQQNGSLTVRALAGVGNIYYFNYFATALQGSTNTAVADSAQKQLPKAAPVKHKQNTRDLKDLSGVLILFVEDNIMSQRVGKATLENWGALVTLADRGKAAVEILKQSHFDLILMDLQMPEMSGIEATIVIRQELQLETPILAMTVSEMQTKREACIKAGMDDYILKPLKPEELLQKINGLLNKHDTKATEKLTNINYVKSITGNDVTLMKEVLEIYTSRTPELLAEVEQLISLGNFNAAQSQIHYLKNSVGLLGADSLFHMLANIEDQLNYLPPTKETLVALIRMKEVVLESIQETEEELKLL